MPKLIRLTFASAWFRRAPTAGVAAKLRTCSMCRFRALRDGVSDTSGPDRSAPTGWAGFADRFWTDAGIGFWQEFAPVRRLRGDDCRCCLPSAALWRAAITVWRTVRFLGHTFKKRMPVADERDRPDVKRRRAQWKRHQDRHGPAPGMGAQGRKAAGCRRMATFIGTLCHDRIDAPWVLDGPINGDAFQIYVETQLIPTSAAATSSSWTI